MTKQEKIQEIKDLTTEISSVKNLYLTDIAGLNAVQTTALRRACFKSNIKLSVVKNTLFGESHGCL
jgi:large subunit ribosomal protein L10